MRKMKIYICGKVTGDQNYKEKFRKEENRLYSHGFEPVNPAAFISPDAFWSIAMKTALRAMLLCDGVSLLPDWKKSKGAKIEVQLAKELKMDVRENKKWEEEKKA